MDILFLRNHSLVDLFKCACRVARLLLHGRVARVGEAQLGVRAGLPSSLGFFRGWDLHDAWDIAVSIDLAGAIA